MQTSVSEQSKKTEGDHSPFAADEEQPYIFISYAHADRELVFPVITRLYEKGWRIWYDQGLNIGGDYYDCLAKHIRECAVVMLMQTQRAVESKFVTDKELKYASSNGRQMVIYELEKDVALPEGVKLAVGDAPRCDEDSVEAALESIEGLTRGDERTAVGITVNVPVDVADTSVAEDDEYAFEAVPGGVRLTKYLGSETEVVVPSEYKGRRVVKLERTFADNKSLKAVTIPAGVTSIGYSTFYDCSSLQRISIPAGVTSIGYEAFYGCSSLQRISIPAGVTSIGYSTFASCSGLVIRCADGSAAHEYAAENGLRFETDDSLNADSTTENPPIDTDLNENSSVFAYLSYAEDDAGQAAEIRKALEKKGCVIRTPDEAGNEYERMGMLTECACFVALLSKSFINGGMTAQIENAGRLSKPFVMFELEECTLPTSVAFKYDSIQRLQHSAAFDENIAKLVGFLNENGCVNAEIPFDYRADKDGITVVKWRGDETEAVIEREYGGVPVTSIGRGAFSDCSSLTAVSIPDNVTSIGELAFRGCSSLTAVTIPDSVTSIGDWAFRDCSSLTAVTIPDSVTSIGYWAFGGCSSLKAITVDEKNKAYSSADGVLYTKDISEILCCPAGKSGRFNIPDNVTSIGDWAFDGCSSLTAVTIPDSVTSIGNYAFHDCGSLTAVTIPDSVTSIGNDAFNGCSSLTAVTIPDSVTSIGDWAFEDCSSLTAVTIPDSVTSIGGSAFNGCSSLTAVTIPDSVTSVGDSAFSGCSSLTAVTIPDSVTSIGDSAFRGCSSLTAVTIPDSVTSIGNEAFRGCSSLTAVTIPDSVTSIGGWAFYGCSSLTAVTISDSVTSIGHSAFEGCSKLTAYGFPDSRAWQYCKKHKIRRKPLKKYNPAKKRRSPLAWLIPLLCVLVLAGAAAAVQLFGIFDLLGWLSGLLGL